MLLIDEEPEKTQSGSRHTAEPVEAELFPNTVESSMLLRHSAADFSTMKSELAQELERLERLEASQRRAAKGSPGKPTQKRNLMREIVPVSFSSTGSRLYDTAR